MNCTLAPLLLGTFRQFFDGAGRISGGSAALRYETLILQALYDIEDDPKRPGSKERPELMIEGARTYHLWFSRGRASGTGVSEPRHFLLYRFREQGVIELARILHDDRDLQSQLRDDYRFTGRGD